MLAQHSQASDRWYTPDWILIRARQAVGEFDLDPCSDDNSRVLATHYYGGLGELRQWFGTVWCNPPGQRGMPAKFWHRSVEHANYGGTVLFLCYSLEQIYQFDAGRYPICIFNKRVKYLSPEGVERKSPTHGSALVLLNKDWEMLAPSFYTAFQDVGRIVVPRVP